MYACVPSSTRIGAERLFVLRTRLPPSTTGCRSAPTDWNSTCACPAMASSSSTTTRRSSGRRTDGGAWRSCTADELAHIDAGHWFTSADARTNGSEPVSYPYRGQGHGIPRLQQVLSRYPGVPLIIELKVNDPELARRTIQEIRAARAIDRVSLGSFGWRVLRMATKARTLHPDRRVAGRSPARPLPFVDPMAAREGSVSGVSSPRALGPDARRLAQFHSARASGRAAGEGLDGQRSR